MNSMNGFMGAGATNTGRDVQSELNNMLGGVFGKKSRSNNPNQIFGGGSRGGGKGDIIPKGYRAGQLQQFTPEQMDLLQQLYQHVNPESYLSRLAEGDEDLFEEMEQPAFRQFSSLLGNIGSRFSGTGGTGSRRSSGFQNYTSQAASEFAQDLASRRQELQRNAIRDLMGLGESLLGQRPYERIVAGKKQKEPGLLSQFGSNFAQSAGKSLGQQIFGGNSSQSASSVAQMFGG